MEIEYDEAKRRTTLHHRGLDFERAIEVFSGPGFDIVDDRLGYGEMRMLTFGLLDGRNVAVVWTMRGDNRRRIISMRHVHDYEIERRRQQLD